MLQHVKPGSSLTTLQLLKLLVVLDVSNSEAIFQQQCYLSLLVLQYRCILSRTSNKSSATDISPYELCANSKALNYTTDGSKIYDFIRQNKFNKFVSYTELQVTKKASFDLLFGKFIIKFYFFLRKLVPPQNNLQILLNQPILNKTQYLYINRDVS